MSSDLDYNTARRPARRRGAVMKATLTGIEIEYQDGGQGPAVLLGHG